MTYHPYRSCISLHLARDNFCPLDRTVIYYTLGNYITSALWRLTELYLSLYFSMKETWLAQLSLWEVVPAYAAWDYAHHYGEVTVHHDDHPEFALTFYPQSRKTRDIVYWLSLPYVVRIITYYAYAWADGMGRIVSPGVRLISLGRSNYRQSVRALLEFGFTAVSLCMLAGVPLGAVEMLLAVDERPYKVFFFKMVVQVLARTSGVALRREGDLRLRVGEGWQVE